MLSVAASSLVRATRAVKERRRPHKDSETKRSERSQDSNETVLAFVLAISAAVSLFPNQHESNRFSSVELLALPLLLKAPIHNGNQLAPISRIARA